MNGLEFAALIIATVSVGTIIGAAVGYYSAARTFEQERENLIDAIDAAMFKVAADNRTIEAENELRLTQQELEYAKRRAQENENARTTVAAIALALDEHYATES